MYARFPDMKTPLQLGSLPQLGADAMYTATSLIAIRSLAESPERTMIDLYTAGTMAVGAVAAPLLLYGGLYYVGFTTAGVAATSWAAWMQGPAVVAGGVFATAQSIAATAPLAVTVAAAATGATVTAVAVM